MGKPVLEIETALAESHMEAQEHGVIIPKVICANVFSTFCWDNIDLLEETLSGRGTTHCTNGIVVQRQVAGCALPPTVPQKKSYPKADFSCNAKPGNIYGIKRALCEVNVKYILLVKLRNFEKS